MSAIYTFKIQGQTAAAAAIATEDVTIDGDGMLRFTDDNGDPRAIPVEGDFAKLCEKIFTGAGGVDSGFKFMV